MAAAGDQRVEVVHLGGAGSLRAAGVRRDDVVAFRWGLDVGERTLDQVSFLLLDVGVLIARPRRMRPDREGWWYCDLVSIEERAGRVTVSDLYVDVLVAPAPGRYELLDLDEFGAAVASGRVPVDRAADGLTRLQSFLDRLRADTGTSGSRGFPPPVVAELARRTDLPREWHWFDAADCDPRPRG